MVPVIISLIVVITIFLSAIMILRFTGSNTESKISMAVEFYNGAKYKRAIEILSDVIKHEPHHLTAHYYLGLAYQHSGDLKIALAELKNILLNKKFSPEVKEKDVHIAISEIYLQEKKTKMALAEYLTVLQTHPDDIDLKMRVADIYIDAGAKDKAATILKEIIAADAKNPQAVFRLGRILFEMNRYKDAITYLEKAKAANPDSTDLLFYLGMSKKGIMDYQGGHGDLSNAARDAKYRLRAMIGMGECLENQGNYQDAVTIFKQAVAMHTDNIDQLNHARYQLAELHLKMKDADEAISMWRTILSDDAEFKDVSAKLKTYENLFDDDRIKDFFIAPYTFFMSQVKKMAENMDYTVAETKKVNDDFIIVYGSKKGTSVAEKNMVILFFIRTNEPVKNEVMTHMEEELVAHNTRNGMIVATSIFSPSVIEVSRNSSVILYDKFKLSEMLKKIKN